MARVGAGFKLYHQKLLTPNDEGISYKIVVRCWKQGSAILSAITSVPESYRRGFQKSLLVSACQLRY